MQACNLVYPYFENPEMLKRQVENWNSYSEEVYEAIRIILVDDNSTKEARPIFEQCRAPKALLRFMEPALWTMHEARNLGALGGASSWPGQVAINERYRSYYYPRNACAFVDKTSR